MVKVIVKIQHATGGNDLEADVWIDELIASSAYLAVTIFLRLSEFIVILSGLLTKDIQLNYSNLTTALQIIEQEFS